LRGESRSAKLDWRGENAVVRGSSGDAVAVGELLRESRGGSSELHDGDEDGEVLLLILLARDASLTLQNWFSKSQRHGEEEKIVRRKKQRVMRVLLQLNEREKKSRCNRRKNTINVWGHALATGCFGL